MTRDSEGIAVEPQVFDLLVYLVENRDRVVSKDDLISAIWHGRIVSDSTLTSRITAARRAIGDSGEEQKLIRTVARKGLRFVGQVRAGVPVATAESRSAPALPPERPAIAVLPFANLSGDPEQEYFSDGISEDIITALSRLRWFPIVARNSSFTYKGKAVHLKQIGEELGARYVFEGSVRKSGDRVRITAQLNDVASDKHLWAQRYDRDLADIFAVQDEITEAIVAAIEPHLIAAENIRAQRKPTDSMDAWDLLMRGLSHYWRASRQDHMVAEALLEKAIAIDPNYGQALGVLASSYMFAAHMGWTDMRGAVARSERAALAAIRIDNEDPWGHKSLGHCYLFARRFEDAIGEIEHALRLNPSFALAHCWHCLSLAMSGRWQEGVAAADRALRLSPRDPFSPMFMAPAAFAHYLGGNYDVAVTLCREALRLRGDFVGAYRVLAASAAMGGQMEIARSAIAECRRTQPNISIAWIAANLPIQHDTDREHYLEGFRRAGLT